MWGVSERFRQTIAESHNVVVRAEVLADGVPILDLTPAGAGVLTTGNVTVDRRNAPRRRMSVRLVDVEGALVPADATAALAPYGNEVRLHRGVRYPDGTVETVPQGIYQLQRATVEDSADGLVITLEGNDRSAWVSDARWDDVYPVAAGQLWTDVLEAALADRYADVVVDFEAIDDTTPKLVWGADAANSDPWGDFQKAAAALGCDLFFDQRGVCVLRTTLDPTELGAAAEFVEGETATILNASRVFDRAGGYNGVIATGESTSNDTPVRAVVWDDDPSSPTYYLGKYGKKPLFFSSPLITTTTQATKAARSRLRKLIGATEAVEFSAIPHPALDGDDAVLVTRARAGITAIYMADQIEMPLTAEEEMRVVCRIQGTVDDEEAA